jgi:hypothetical protein
MKLRQIEDGYQHCEVSGALGWNAHLALAPEPFGLLGQFAKGCRKGFLAAKGHEISRRRCLGCGSKLANDRCDDARTGSILGPEASTMSLLSSTRLS